MDVCSLQEINSLGNGVFVFIGFATRKNRKNLRSSSLKFDALSLSSLSLLLDTQTQRQTDGRIERRLLLIIIIKHKRRWMPRSVVVARLLLLPRDNNNNNRLFSSQTLSTD
tara:strand:+ start:1351 stop:1683 length:333 start_codon:yes stop_codon:yes gene_type:complete